MALPKDLLPITEREILEECAKELNLPLKDVNKTFDIWLDYLQWINDETDECTKNFPTLGKMYLNFTKLRDNTDYLWEAKKRARVKREIPTAKKNHHQVTLPINLVYGVGRKNYKLGRKPDDKYAFFTKEECIRRQNETFFKEDFKYNDRKDIYEEYFNDIPKQQHEHIQYPKGYQSEIKRQEQIKRRNMVRREKKSLQEVPTELKEQ